MSKFTCQVEGCQKELSRLQVMHFRSSHGCDPVEWVENQYGQELADLYASGDGSYTIAAEYEWLTSDMVCEVVDTRSQHEALRGDANPMTRDEVVKQFKGDANPAKRSSVREKIRQALTGRSRSPETKKKISRANTGNTISEEHRQKISEGSSNRDTSYMQTEEYRETLSEALKGNEPTYPTPYDVEELSHMVRSSWEEDVGRILVGNDIEYRYEVEFKLSIGSYYADFVLDEHVVEVKGFSNERSVNKAVAFMDEFPEYTYVVIGDEIPCDIHVPWDDRTRILEVLSDG